MCPLAWNNLTELKASMSDSSSLLVHLLDVLVLNETPAEEMHRQGGEGMEEPMRLKMKKEKTYDVAADMVASTLVVIHGGELVEGVEDQAVLPDHYGSHQGTHGQHIVCLKIVIKGPNVSRVHEQSL